MPNSESTGNSLRAVPRSEVERDNWDGLVRTSPDGWVFGLHDWQDLILAVAPWGLEEHSFGLMENGNIVAVVPLQYNPKSEIMASSGWGGVGPVLAADLSNKARKRILSRAISHCKSLAEGCGARAFDIRLSPVTQTSLSAPWGVNPLQSFGLDDRSGLSRVIDLQQAEDVLWARLAADARRQIRIAREAGFTAERADWGQSLDHYYELHCETYRRTGVPPHPKAYFEGIARTIAPLGHSFLWRVKDAAGDVVGYHNDACLGSGAYYHTGCSRNATGETGAGYLLFWEAMMGAKAKGFRWYDCGAVFPHTRNAKQQGLTTFKTKFGGEDHRLFGGHMPIANEIDGTQPTPRRDTRRSARTLIDTVARHFKS